MPLPLLQDIPFLDCMPVQILISIYRSRSEARPLLPINQLGDTLTKTDVNAVLTVVCVLPSNSSQTMWHDLLLTNCSTCGECRHGVGCGSCPASI